MGKSARYRQFILPKWIRTIKQEQTRFENHVKELRVRAQFEPESMLKKQMQEAVILSAMALPRHCRWGGRKGEFQRHPDGEYRCEAYLQMAGSPKMLWRVTEMLREAILEQDFKEEPMTIRVGVKELGKPLYFQEIEGSNFVAIRKWVQSHDQPPTGKFNHRYYPQWGMILVKFQRWGEVWFSDEGGLNAQQELMLRKKYEIVQKRGLQEAVEDLG